MITSFEVQAVLIARDDVSPVLMRLAEKFRELERIIERVDKRLAAFGAAFEQSVVPKAESMAKGVQMAMGQIDAAVVATTANIRRMAEEMKDVAGSAWAANARGQRAAQRAAGGGGSTVMGGIPIGGGGRGGAPGIGNASEEAESYRPWQDWQGRNPSFPLPYPSSNIYERERQKRANESFARKQEEEEAETARVARAAREREYIYPLTGGGLGGGGGRRGGGGRPSEPVGGGRGRAGLFPHAPHFSATGPGDTHMRVPLTPVAAGALGVIMGVGEELKVEEEMARVFFASGRPLAPEMQRGTPLWNKTRDTLLESYMMSGMPLKDYGDAILKATRGLAPNAYEDRLRAMPGLLRASTMESFVRGGETSIPEAMEQFTALPHMEGQYSPDEMEKMAMQFAYLSSISNRPIQEITRASSYVIPRARLMGFKPEELITGVVRQQVAGNISTKSGTWLRSLTEYAMQDPATMSEKKRAAYDYNMQRLGLFATGTETPQFYVKGEDYAPAAFREPGAFPSMMRIAEVAGEHIPGLAKIDPRLPGSIEQEVFKERGGSALATLSDPTMQKLFKQTREDQKNWTSAGPDRLWSRIVQNDPKMQIDIVFAKLNVQLMNFAQNIIPYVTAAVEKANEMLKTPGGTGTFWGGILGSLAGSTLLSGMLGGGARGLLGGGIVGAVVGAAVGGLIAILRQQNSSSEVPAATHPWDSPIHLDGGLSGQPATLPPSSGGPEADQNRGAPNLFAKLWQQIKDGRGSGSRWLERRHAAASASSALWAMQPGNDVIWERAQQNAAVMRSYPELMRGGDAARASAGLPASGAAGSPVVNVPAPQVNIKNAPEIKVTNILDSAQIVSQVKVQVTEHIMKTLGAALHIGNTTSQSPAGGTLDAPAAAGTGVNQ